MPDQHQQAFPGLSLPGRKPGQHLDVTGVYVCYVATRQWHKVVHQSVVG